MSAADELQRNAIGSRLSLHWWGQIRRVDDSTLHSMTSILKGDPEYFCASKRLYNYKMACFAKVKKLRNTILGFWKASTLPFVEAGIRLLPNSQIEQFSKTMVDYQEKLAAAAGEVQKNRDAIVSDAKTRLGDAFVIHNYPENLGCLFNAEWSFQAVTPPSYLSQLAPEVYEREKKRVTNQLEESVRLAEQAFAQELYQLVVHLRERLTPDATGKPKILCASAISNIHQFIERFRTLNITGNAEVKTLTDQAESMLLDVDAKDLRTMPMMRHEIAQDMKQIEDKLSKLVTCAPRRKIVTFENEGLRNETANQPKAAQPA